MPIDRQELKAWLARLREVLNREWDPIGVLPYDGGPEDEYDRYRDKLASMISAHATDEELKAYLELAASEEMGLGPPTDAKLRGDSLRRVVAEIRTLGPPPRSS